MLMGPILIKRSSCLLKVVFCQNNICFMRRVKGYYDQLQSLLFLKFDNCFLNHKYESQYAPWLLFVHFPQIMALILEEIAIDNENRISPLRTRQNLKKAEDLHKSAMNLARQTWTHESWVTMTLYEAIWRLWKIYHIVKRKVCTNLLLLILPNHR